MADESRTVAQERIKPEIGMMSPAEGRQWRKAQVPYRNYAGFSDHLDASCVTFVNSCVERFRNAMAAPMKRWSVNWAAANTEVFWGEHEDDVHMPETKKALDSKVARVEEAVTQFDPVFEVEGIRTDLNRRTAKTLGQYVYRQMELARWRNYVQPSARDAELCNTAALKVVWDHREETIVERHDRTEYDDDGMPVHIPIRKMRRAVTYRGPRIHQVDPFWFIHELEAQSPEDCAYIGDESMQFLHELKAMAEQGVYSKTQVEKVGERIAGHNGGRDRKSGSTYVDQLRRYRSIALGTDMLGMSESDHGATRVRVVEMWALFDFGSGFDGVVDPLGKRLTGVQRMVITLADGIPIRIQQNPFDRKFVPYAFVQVNRNGHELVAPAPFDSVVQMNAHYDRWSSNVMRWMDLSVSPLIITQDQNSDLPESILDVEPGAVLHNTGQWNFVKMPDLTSSVSYFQGFFRNEMEELSGALRIHESPQGTATETERKVQEQQRMVRNSIRAAGELWRQVALLIKCYSEQFATGPEQFRVVGKAQKLLGRKAAVTPAMLKEDVDFRFLGLTDLHTFGNRAQGMAQYMNMWGPMLQSMSDLNLPRMSRMHFELLVGHAGTQEIFPDDSAPWESWSQREENEMLAGGLEVEINERDDHQQHLDELIPFLKSLVEKKAPKFLLDLAAEHLNQHMEALQRQQAEQQAEEKTMMRRQMLSQMTGGTPGVDKPPEPGGMPAQAKPVSGRPGVTPGPDQARTVSRTGRDGIGQSQQQELR